MAEPVIRDPVKSRDQEDLVGFLAAGSAYLLWGFLPFFMKAIEHISVFEIVTHRILWSPPVALAFIIITRRTGDFLSLLARPRDLAILALTATIISTNWSMYVWAIVSEQAVEAALGYYINPLITVAMGMVFLKEKLRTAQWVALALAAIAVGILTVNAGTVPILALALAVTFASYGLIRKTVNVGPTQGFLVEATLLSIPAIPFAFWFASRNDVAFLGSNFDTMMLIACGPVTAIPLILFSSGAKKLTMATLGLMQYIVPTMIFLIGVFVFKEPFNQVQLIAFVFIWAAVAIYSWSMLREANSRK